MFATRAISSGTRILRDKSVMHLKGSTLRLDQGEIMVELKKMSSPDQQKFLSLHEGLRSFPTKEMRIWKANAFNTGDDSYVYLDISRFNHSCLPNAETEENHEGGTADVYAIRDIAKGEEVFICYNSIYYGATRKQRQNALKAYYGFECACAACCVGERAAQLSDARRKIIHAMTHLRKGMNPPDMSLLDRLSLDNAEDPRVRAGTWEDSHVWL